MTWGALLATMFTLVGCGGTSLRRSLVTDETPLGTPRHRAITWHLENGWCLDESPHPAMDQLHPCAGPDRHRMRVMLAFSADEALVAAVVTVNVPPPREPRPLLLPAAERRTTPDGVPLAPERRTPHGFGRHTSSRDVAIDVMDALASELTARYGPPQTSTWTERRWTTRTKNIRLSWRELVEDIFVVIEEHHALGPGTGLASAP